MDNKADDATKEFVDAGGLAASHILLKETIAELGLTGKTTSERREGTVMPQNGALSIYTTMLDSYPTLPSQADGLIMGLQRIDMTSTTKPDGKGGQTEYIAEAQNGKIVGRTVHKSDDTTDDYVERGHFGGKAIVQELKGSCTDGGNKCDYVLSVNGVEKAKAHVEKSTVAHENAVTFVSDLTITKASDPTNPVKGQLRVNASGSFESFSYDRIK